MIRNAPDDEVDVAKLGRMHGVVLSVLGELRTLDLDPASRDRLEALTQRTLVEIGSAVPDDLLRELGRIIGGGSGSDPTGDELRVIDAQLLGWLRGMARAERLGQLQAVVDRTRDAAAQLAPTDTNGYL